MITVRQRAGGSRGLALAMAAGCFTGSAVAQVQEIIVTAQKRSENIQEVPIAIQAMTGDQLQEMGLKRSDEIMGQFANVSTAGQSETNRNYFVRGVGTSDFHLNSVGAVGLYVDEVSITSPYGGSFALYDMERVEVLRGPQVALFGRNTTGGAINYVTRRPVIGEDVNGYLTATYGRYDQMDFEAAVGTPIGERVAIRAAGSWNQRDGLFDNLTTGEDQGKRDRTAGRFQALWEVNEDLTLLGNIHGGVNRGEGRPYKAVGTLDPTTPFVPNPAFPATPGAVPFVSNLCSAPATQVNVHDEPNCVNTGGFRHLSGDWNEVFGAFPHREDLDLWGTSLRADWTFGQITLTSITAYDSTEVVRTEDTDGSPNHLFEFTQENDLDQWSQELRLASGSEQVLRWITGFYWFFEESDYSTVVRRVPGNQNGINRGDLPTSFSILPNTRVNQDTEVFSLYAQFDYDLQDDLTATVGVRWSREEKDGWNRPSLRCGSALGGPPFCAGAPSFPQNATIGFDEIDAARSFPFGVPVPLPVTALELRERETGLRFALDWQALDNVLAYASVSRGFKSGGFSLAALQAINGLAGQSVNAEVLWAYELGLKTSWFDDTVLANVSGFRYDWTDLQAFEPFVVGGVTVPQLVNVPESRIYGVDMEGTWAPGDGWTVQGAIGILDTEIENPGAIATVARGNELSNAPDLTFTGSVRKEWQVGPGRLALQTNARHQSDVFYSVTNRPQLSEESIWLVGARGSYRFGPEQQYDLTVWGENLTDEEYCLNTIDLTGQTAEAYNCMPSDGVPTYGITATVRFE